MRVLKDSPVKTEKSLLGEHQKQNRGQRVQVRFNTEGDAYNKHVQKDSKKEFGWPVAPPDTGTLVLTTPELQNMFPGVSHTKNSAMLNSFP